MLLRDWLQGWWQNNVRTQRPIRTPSRATCRPKRRRARCAALIESLEGRTLPTTLDLHLLPNSLGTVLLNDNSNDLSGTAVSNAGDIDGDGFDDVLISAPGNAGLRGAVYIIFGGTALPSSLDLQNLGIFGMTIRGVDTGDYAGSSISAAGDVNGDGFDDLLIGAPKASSQGGARFHAGETYIVYGDDDLPFVLDLFFLGNRGTVIYGAEPGDNSGSAVSSAGDVNRDGFDDILIGAAHSNGQGNGRANSGEAYVIYGDSSLPNAIDLLDLGTYGSTIYGAHMNDSLGTAVSSAGDMNGDGFDDLILGAPDADGIGYLRSNSGETYVIFGAAAFPTSIDLAGLDGLGITIYGAKTNDASGTAVSNIGDFNGDGFEDVALTAPFADGPGDTRTDAGDTYLIFGAAALVNDIDLADPGSASSTLYGAQATDRSGRSVRGAGDINGDGFDDVILGAPRTYGLSNGRPYSGESYVVFGSSMPDEAIDLGSLSNSEGIVIFGADAGDASGSTVSGAGDVDGDGFDDLVIGAYAAQGPDNEQLLAGEAYIIYGGNFTDSVTHLGNNSDNTLTGTANADIMNGAGRNDTVIGNGGADVLYGGQGNDVLAISTLDFQRVDGGNGNDTLRLDGAGLNLDLTLVADTRLAKLETIDIRGSGANTLTLDLFEVLILSENSNPNHREDTLFIRRDLDDTANIGAGWTADGTASINGVLYDVFIQGTATLYVQNTDPTVTLSITPGPIAEAGGVATVTATLSAISSENVTIDLGFSGTATSPADYTASSTQIIILAGNLNGSIMLTAVDDEEFEGTETITVSITSVINGVESGTQQVATEILDDDFAPVFTSTATPSTPENQLAVLTVTATDADLPAQTITFSITGGADAGLFSITPTGDLSFTSAPDFENPDDANGDNVYIVQVSANDGHGGVTTQTLSVTVTNVVEPVEVSVSGQAVTYIKKQPPILVLPNATVAGVNLGSGTLVLDVNVIARKNGTLIDQFGFPSVATIGTSTGPQLVGGHLMLTVNLSAAVTPADIQTFLRGITFSTKGKGLKTPTRSLQVTLTNNVAQTAMTTQTINVRRKA